MMEFHPDKCEVISITRSRNPVNYQYSLHGHILKHVDTVKYLGVKINKDLRWDKHINMTTDKANNTLNFLRRNIKIGNPHLKQHAYKTLVRPILEYGQTVWDPYTATLSRRIESIQRRAARFTTNRYRRTSSVTAMLNHLEWQPLAERRRIARLMMFYKIHNGHVAVSMPLQYKGLSAPSRTENSQAYTIPASTADYHQMSFFPRTARDWNILPETVVSARTPDAFRSALLRSI